MRIRTLAPFVLALTVACGEAATDDTAMAEEPQEYAAEAEADAGAGALEAVAAVGEYWQTHFNMGHGSMVADKYVDTGLLWNGSGAMVYGKEAIAAALQTSIDELGSQIQLHPGETLAFGNFAATRGHFVMTNTVDGAEVTNSGHYMSLAENIDGEWMLHGGVSNLDSPDQTVVPAEAMEAPEGQGAELVQERLDYYRTHFNMGHASMVSALYTADAVVMGSGQALTTGRAAAEARLQGMIDAGAQIENVTAWSARELDDNTVTGVGTYTISGQDGHFAALWKRGDDGELRVHWLLTATHPGAM